MNPAANQDRPSDYVWGLVCGLPEPLRSNRPLLMLKAYIDDSRMNQPPVYVLAGWVAPAKVWAPFADDWSKILRMSPRIEYFKFAEAMNFNGQFSGFSEQSRNEKMSLLVNLIEEYKLFGVASIIPHALFQEYFGPYPDLNNPYHPSFCGLIATIARHYQSAGTNGKIDLIFDYQPGSMALAQAGWALFRKTMPQEFRELLNEHPPTFLDDKQCIPLQAADLCAGRLRMVHDFSIRGVEPPEPPWGNSGSTLRAIQYVWTPQLAQKFFHELFGFWPVKVTYTFHHGLRS